MCKPTTPLLIPVTVVPLMGLYTPMSALPSPFGSQISASPSPELKDSGEKVKPLVPLPTPRYAASLRLLCKKTPALPFA